MNKHVKKMIDNGRIIEEPATFDGKEIKALALKLNKMSMYELFHFLFFTNNVLINRCRKEVRDTIISLQEADRNELDLFMVFTFDTIVDTCKQNKFGRLYFIDCISANDSFLFYLEKSEVRKKNTQFGIEFEDGSIRLLTLNYGE